MVSRLAWLLDAINIRNLCFLYFLVTPFFLDRKNSLAITLLFGAGYVLSALIVMLALGERLSALSHRIRYSSMTLLVAALVFVSMFSVAVNTPAHLLSPSLVYFKYGKLVLPALVFFVMVRIWDRRDLPKLARLLLTFGILSLCLSFIELIVQAGGPKGFSRIGSWVVGDANKYAVVLNILYGFLLAEFISRKMSGLRASMVGWLILLVAVGVLLTQSRGGVLAFVIVTFTCLFASRSRRMIQWGIGMMIPFAVLVFLVFLYRYSQPGSVELSDLGRIWTYIVAWNAIQKNPLFGVGFGNTDRMYDKYGPEYELLMGLPMDVHNTVLEVFAQQGIVGLVVFLTFIFLPFTILIRRIIVLSRTHYPLEEVVALVIPMSFLLYGMISHQYIANEFFWAYISFTTIVMYSPSPGRVATLFGERKNGEGAAAQVAS